MAVPLRVGTLSPARPALLPSTYAVLTHPAVAALRASVSGEILASLVRQAKRVPLDGARTKQEALEAIVAEVVRAAGELTLPRRRLINATGIVIHTGLGTAPLSDLARQRVLQATMATPTGAEGFQGRTETVERMLCVLTGAEAACVTAQNAATCTLIGAALAGSRDIICAARDLLEISRGIRLRDLIETGGGRIVPVGSANCVRARDYQEALTPHTACILRIWHSNYATSGYVADVDIEKLALLAHGHNLHLVVNLGAGSLVDLRERGLPYSPTIQDALDSGADLVLASGDKLIGGPQAGIAVGRAGLVHQLVSHPVYRAVRPAKMDIAALEGTLASYLGGRAWEEIPVLRMLAATPDQLQPRAAAVAAEAIPGQIHAAVVADTARCGGAALPDTALPTWVVQLTSQGHTTDTLYGLLAAQAVIARRAQHAVLVDLRSVCPEDDALIARALREVTSPPSAGAK